MSYLILKEASEATKRRLCKKAEVKLFVQMKKGKQGPMYTVQVNYLFNVYSPLNPYKNSVYTRVDNDRTSLDKEPIQYNTALLSAKDEIIQILKSETAY